MTIKAGGNAKLDFNITGKFKVTRNSKTINLPGDPKPKVTWLCNGEPIADGDANLSCATEGVSCTYLDNKQPLRFNWA